MNERAEIIILTDESKNIVGIEGLPAGTPVRILRKKAKLEVGPEVPPQLQWFGVTWHVLCGRTLVKCYNEQEARRYAGAYTDAQKAMSLEGDRKVKRERYDPAEEEEYISSVDQDEDTLRAGAEVEREAG